MTIVKALIIMGLLSFLFGCSKQPSIPNDENGHILRQMLAQGDDQTKPRDVEFQFIFDTEQQATQFVAQVKSATGLKAEASRYEARNMWDTTVTKNMVPTHQDITSLEQSLSRLAETSGGKADGWGCFIVKKGQ